MGKSQNGNKEAKKPKKLPTPPQPASGTAGAPTTAGAQAVAALRLKKR